MKSHKMKMFAAVLFAAVMMFGVVTESNAYDVNSRTSPENQAEVDGYRKAADQGNADAQDKLGFAYYHGIGVEKDLKEGVKWMRKAADQGNANAQFGLGNAYCTGSGVEKDDKEGFKWWHKAADQGIVQAQKLLDQYAK